MNFEQAAEKVKNLPQKPNDDDMLQLYGLYKQSLIGDVNTERPSFWDLVGKAKWDSWKTYEGISESAAKLMYIQFVDSLISKY